MPRNSTTYIRPWTCNWTAAYFITCALCQSDFPHSSTSQFFATRSQSHQHFNQILEVKNALNFNLNESTAALTGDTYLYHRYFSVVKKHTSHGWSIPSKQTERCVISSMSPENRPIDNAIACDLCFHKKIKCDMLKPTCSNCRVYNSQCRTTSVRKSYGTERSRLTSNSASSETVRHTDSSNGNE